MCDEVITDEYFLVYESDWEINIPSDATPTTKTSPKALAYYILYRNYLRVHNSSYLSHCISMTKVQNIKTTYMQDQS